MKKRMRQLRILAAAALALGLFSADTRSQTPFTVRSFSFDPSSGISNRLLTPNGDLKNDAVIFTFSNPRDSAVSGSVFDMMGAEVESMSDGPALAFPLKTLMWDGKSNGKAVKGGVYIYQIRSEDTLHTGTVVVIS